MRLSNLDTASTEVSGATQGWTSSSGGRGTLDIVWSCFLTIFLCGWSTICINIPSQKSTPVERFWRNFLVFCESLAGPEFIFHTALGQYLAAKKSITKFNNLGLHGWTIRHGFYAVMGGFTLYSPDFVPFPLTVDQVFYLVEHRYIDFDSVRIDKSEIEDKNKFDTLTRVLTVTQLVWFVVNVIARAVLLRTITTLELSTMGFIFCTVFTCYFWRSKPQDVSSTTAIELKVPLADVLTSAGDIAQRPYSYTPLDFANEEPHWFQLVWRYCFNIPNMFGFHFHSMKRPVDKIWDDQFSHLGPWHSALLAFVQLSFAAIHFSAWNFHFPTNIERWLWRGCAAFMPISMACTWIAIYAGFGLFPQGTTTTEHKKSDLQPSEREVLSGASTRHFLYAVSHQLHRLPCQSHKRRNFCNNSLDRNPAENIPILIAIFLIPLGALYICARMYIIIEDIINLRSLPSAAFDAIDWMSFLPHF